ncbi:uncharacterized protein CLUP02_18199 [Colletotrichum lupini]|uniref:Uncharacterized protein n=1 Tax=Colletotrichum lupini TaxID=145971 RepID=A0A9Q8WBM6_9PEZI|nr:uncharacterized protein CLUP02_18199 [Colletotrichum lupini]UQC76685.1 hypothetical protein CLUP02_18199 [Colletotrichum lupini]
MLGDGTSVLRMPLIRRVGYKYLRLWADRSSSTLSKNAVDHRRPRKWTQRSQVSSSSGAANRSKVPEYLRILDQILHGLHEPSRSQHLKESRRGDVFVRESGGPSRLRSKMLEAINPEILAMLQGERFSLESHLWNGTADIYAGQSQLLERRITEHTRERIRFQQRLEAERNIGDHKKLPSSHFAQLPRQPATETAKDRQQLLLTILEEYAALIFRTLPPSEPALRLPPDCEVQPHSSYAKSSKNSKMGRLGLQLYEELWRHVNISKGDSETIPIVCGECRNASTGMLDEEPLFEPKAHSCAKGSVPPLKDLQFRQEDVSQIKKSASSRRIQSHIDDILRTYTVDSGARNSGHALGEKMQPPSASRRHQEEPMIDLTIHSPSGLRLQRPRNISQSACGGYIIAPPSQITGHLELSVSLDHLDPIAPSSVFNLQIMKAVASLPVVLVPRPGTPLDHIAAKACRETAPIDYFPPVADGSDDADVSQ